MSSYTDYDLERDLHEARRARDRARGRGHERGHERRGGGLGNFLRSRTTDHWIMFAIGLVIGAILF